MHSHFANRPDFGGHGRTRTDKDFSAGFLDQCVSPISPHAHMETEIMQDQWCVHNTDFLLRRELTLSPFSSQAACNTTIDMQWGLGLLFISTFKNHHIIINFCFWMFRTICQFSRFANNFYIFVPCIFQHFFYTMFRNQCF